MESVQIQPCKVVLKRANEDEIPKKKSPSPKKVETNNVVQENSEEFLRYKGSRTRGRFLGGTTDHDYCTYEYDFDSSSDEEYLPGKSGSVRKKNKYELDEFNWTPKAETIRRNVRSRLKKRKDSTEKEKSESPSKTLEQQEANVAEPSNSFMNNLLNSRKRFSENQNSTNEVGKKSAIKTNVVRKEPKGEPATKKSKKVNINAIKPLSDGRMPESSVKQKAIYPNFKSEFNFKLVVPCSNEKADSDEECVILYESEKVEFLQPLTSGSLEEKKQVYLQQQCAQYISLNEVKMNISSEINKPAAFSKVEETNKILSLSLNNLLGGHNQNGESDLKQSNGRRSDTNCYHTSGKSGNTCMYCDTINEINLAAFLAVADLENDPKDYVGKALEFSKEQYEMINKAKQKDTKADWESKLVGENIQLLKSATDALSKFGSYSNYVQGLEENEVLLL